MTSANNPSALPTAFPTEIFRNILGYCNDTIEDRQRKLNKKLMKELDTMYCEVIKELDTWNEGYDLDDSDYDDEYILPANWYQLNLKSAFQEEYDRSLKEGYNFTWNKHCRITCGK